MSKVKKQTGQVSECKAVGLVNILSESSLFLFGGVAATFVLLAYLSFYIGYDSHSVLAQSSTQHVFSEVQKSTAAAILVEEKIKVRNEEQKSYRVGISEENLYPNKIFIDESEMLTFNAKVGVAEDVEVAIVRETTNTGSIPYGLVLYDDGKSGDETAQDGIFTAQQVISISSLETREYVIEILYGDGVKVTSKPLILDVFNKPLEEGDTEDGVALAKKVKEEYLAYRLVMDTESAREKVYDDLKENPDIQYVLRDDSYLSIEYKGVQVVVTLYGPMDSSSVDE